MSGGGHHGGKKGGKHHDDHEEHEEHVNHEAWVIPYADMLTLLMALFLVLFAMGRTDLEKFKKLAESFRSEFGSSAGGQVVSFGSDGTSPLEGGDGVLDAVALPSNGDDAAGTGPGEPTELQIEQARQEAEQAAAEAALDELRELGEQIEQAAESQGLGGNIEFAFNGEGLLLNLVDSAVLFDSGSAELKLSGQVVLQTVVPALQGITNEIAIEGHTDNVGDDDANYELSADRANAVRRFLANQGGFDGRLEIAGWGEERPIADNETAEGRAQNRRVEIIILSDISLEPALQIDG
jgi:chemotaxis protein MotB